MDSTSLPVFLKMIDHCSKLSVAFLKVVISIGYDGGGGGGGGKLTITYILGSDVHCGFDLPNTILTDNITKSP